MIESNEIKLRKNFVESILVTVWKFFFRNNSIRGVMAVMNTSTSTLSKLQSRKVFFYYAKNVSIKKFRLQLEHVINLYSIFFFFIVIRNWILNIFSLARISRFDRNYLKSNAKHFTCKFTNDIQVSSCNICQNHWMLFRWKLLRKLCDADVSFFALFPAQSKFPCGVQQHRSSIASILFIIFVPRHEKKKQRKKKKRRNKKS